MKVPEENDPGEAALSRNWPNVAPGREWCQDGRGQEAYPPQPIVSQTRAVLEAYARNGGSYREDAIEHSRHVEKPERLQRALSIS
jgi:hypothetical protein